jgi:hypothetical protein
MLVDLVGKVDALASRMASLEARRAQDPEDNVLPHPPGLPTPDDGELEATKTAPSEEPRDPVAVEED